MLTYDDCVRPGHFTEEEIQAVAEHEHVPEIVALGTPTWVAVLGLKRMRANRRGARHGFPLHQRERHRATLLRRGMAVLECAARPGHGRACATLRPSAIPVPGRPDTFAGRLSVRNLQ